MYEYKIKKKTDNYRVRQKKEEKNLDKEFLI